MKDRFFEIINQFMLPIDKLEHVIDSSYYLRKNLSFAFAQGYCHPPDGFYGKLINYPDENGILNIFGRKYGTTNKMLVNGKLELIPIDMQLDIHYRVEPELARSSELPPFAQYHTKFRRDDCIGFFDHRRSLEVAMEKYPDLSGTIEKVSEFVEFPMDRLGVTGSLAYGKMEPEHEDVDLTVYGSVEEHQRLIKKISRWVEDPAHRVFEFGKYWPMRFFFEKTLVCPFFIYARPEEIPLAEFTMDLVEDGVPFRARVSDDTHAIYLPIVVGLEDVSLGGRRTGEMPLIIYDSAVRGEFRNGDRIEGLCRVVRVRKGEKEFRSLLVTISTDIKKC